MLAEHLDGEAGDAFGSYSVSLQGSQETESETSSWELYSTMFLCLVGRVWGWQRVQAGPMAGRRVTDRGSESPRGKIIKL